MVACGEIVATSLFQGGPAPKSLDESVYMLMVNPDVNMCELDENKHLTSADRSFLTTIKNDLLMHQEAIIEHGYTGVIDEAHTKEIIKSIIISIVMKRIVYLKEFMKGLCLFDVAILVNTYPEVCKPLFVTDSQNQDVVDANYLFSLMVPEYSPEGSSKRSLEEIIMDHLQDFLFKLEDEQDFFKVATDDVVTVHDSVAPDNTEIPNDDDDAIVDETLSAEQFSQSNLSPAGVMGWLTGQQHKPLNGESIAISVMFNHDCANQFPGHSICYPTAGACGKSLTLPVNHMKTSAEFNDIFISAYCGGQSFDRH